MYKEALESKEATVTFGPEMKSYATLFSRLCVEGKHDDSVGDCGEDGGPSEEKKKKKKKTKRSKKGKKLDGGDKKKRKNKGKKLGSSEDPFRKDL